MNSRWSHLEFGELINGRVGFKSQMKRERNDSPPSSSTASRNMRNFIVSWDLLHQAKCSSANLQVLLVLDCVEVTGIS